MNGMSKHAKNRMDQRGIPPVVFEWLERFGEHQYDGRGAVKWYFSHQSIEQMSRIYGRQFISHNAKYLRAYAVESTDDGTQITCGWLTRRMRRR